MTLKREKLRVFYTYILWFAVYFHKGCSQRNCTGGKGLLLVPPSNITWANLYVGEWLIVDCRLKNMSDTVVVEIVQKYDYASVGYLKRGEHVIKIDENHLNITNVTRHDSGSYFCKVCGDLIERTFLPEISVYGRPYQRPKITVHPNGKTHYGDKVVLRCSINGFYDIELFKKAKNSSQDISLSNGGLQESGSGVDYTQFKETTISNFDESHEGYYACRASRAVVNWTQETEVYLKMEDLSKPSLQNFPNETLILNEGEGFDLKIYGKGSPPPELECFSGSKNSTKKGIMKNRTEWVYLTIKNASYFRDDGRVFRCTATNHNGVYSKSFKVLVFVKPFIKNVRQQEYETTTLGEDNTVNLTCDIYKANPKPAFVWEYSFDINDWSAVHGVENLLIYNKNVLQIHDQSKYRAFYKCTAVNQLGNDSFIWEVIGTPESPELESSRQYLVAIIVVSVIIVLLLALVVFVLYKRKKKYGAFYILSLPPPKDYTKIMDKNKSFQEQAHLLPYLSEWEFPSENITLLHVLGSGAFGIVYLANVIGINGFQPRETLGSRRLLRPFSFFTKRAHSTINNDISKAAVKTLKDNYVKSQLDDIQAELRILIHIGEHENILKILGASTKSEKPMLILEYCPHGNLRDFLKARRSIYIPEMRESDSFNLSITDLVKFAIQISKAMEFLISRKCIHRDLAARNVLVTDGHNCKVSDFGLARDVYTDLEYVKKTSGVLPLKWMAIEAIKDLVFNEKTDVWSYGIVLWEIFTLGGTPYPGTNPVVILESLEKGTRMNAPKHCPEDIEELMKICWLENPAERPTFSQIVQRHNTSLSQIEVEVHKLKVKYQNVPFA